MEITLVIMAAGLGSRYGTYKQIDSVGPNGEVLMEYSLYDATRAGFTKIIIIANENTEEFFRNLARKTLFKESATELKVMLQSPLELSSYGLKSVERNKPWGTGHVLCSLKRVINTPFLVINADDYYGAESFEIMARCLKTASKSEETNYMVAYELDKTLSCNGVVSRGVCDIDDNGFLKSIQEYSNIERKGVEIRGQKHGGERHEVLPPNTPVSMNFWGLQPRIINFSEKLLEEFLRTAKDLAKEEFYIPSIINVLLKKKMIKVKVLRSTSEWVGMTYKEDKQYLEERLRSLTSEGLYPHP